MVAVATSVEETTRLLVSTRERTVPSSVKYEVVVKGSVDARTIDDVMVVLEEKVEGSMVLLPTTTKGSSSEPVTVSTAAVPVRVADLETGTEDVIVLPLLSVVVTAVCDSGVLEGDADVPVADSDALSDELDASVVGSEDCSEDWSEVGVADVEEGPSVGVSEEEGVVESLVGVEVVSWVLDVGADVVVWDVLDGSVVVLSVFEVGEAEVLVVTPVPTTCRLGMTPCGMS